VAINMIKYVKLLIEKYRRISKMADYVPTHDVIKDLNFIIREIRISRIPKKDR